MSHWVLGGAALFREWSIKSLGISMKTMVGHGGSIRVVESP